MLWARAVVSLLLVVNGITTLIHPGLLEKAIGVAYGVELRPLEVRLSWLVGLGVIVVGVVWVTPLWYWVRWVTVGFLIAGALHIGWILISGSKTSCGCGIAFGVLPLWLSNAVGFFRNVFMLILCFRMGESAASAGVGDEAQCV